MPGLDLEEDNNTTTRLLTLLNVSALKSSKRKGTESIEPTPRVKLNKRRSIQFDVSESASPTPKEGEGNPEASASDATGVEDVATVAEDIEDYQGMCGLLHRELSSRLMTFQKKTKTHTRTISAHKVRTYLPHLKAQRNATPGKQADRSGGRSVP